ncbi:hypothetical protein [Candidatus Lokiarchaeum ossiferum]
MSNQVDNWMESINSDNCSTQLAMIKRLYELINNLYVILDKIKPE